LIAVNSKIFDEQGNSTMNVSADSLQQTTETWNHLKQAIANSSGFDSWQSARNSHQQGQQGQPEQPANHQANQASVTDTQLDEQVTDYLRETLETLAY
jgi:hypothetical protein